MNAIQNTVFAGLLLSGLAGGAPLWAADGPRDLAAEVNAANALLHNGDVDGAIGKFRQAQELAPENPQVSYNAAVAQYRKGDVTAAEHLFQSASSSDDDAIAAKARYNAGNCSYASAIQTAEKDRRAAISQLESAIANYRSSLDLDSSNADARANIELAAQLIDKLREELQQQEQQQKRQQDQQQRNDEQNRQDQRQSQDKKQNQQDDQQQDQKEKQDQQEQQDQKEQQDQQQNQSSKDQDSQDKQSPQDKQSSPDKQQHGGQQSKDEQSKAEQSKAEQSKSDESPQNKPGSKPQPQDDAAQQNQPQPSSSEDQAQNPQPQQSPPNRRQQSADKQSPDAEQNPQPADDSNEKKVQHPPKGKLTSAEEVAKSDKPGEPVVAFDAAKDGEMTQQEAEKMLQAIRDRDMIRRLLRQSNERNQQVPVDRDW